MSADEISTGQAAPRGLALRLYLLPRFLLITATAFPVRISALRIFLTPAKKILDIHFGLVYNQFVIEPMGYETASSGRLDATFAALADPTRRAILARLASGDASVNDLARPFAMSQPAISKHLRGLERAGLISRGRDAQRRPRRIEAQPLGEASDWLENYRKFWEGSFQRLDELLDELKSLNKDKDKDKDKDQQARKKPRRPSGPGRRP